MSDMLCFECDYNQNAHEKILQRLVQTSDEKLPGYGSDRYCRSAAEKIAAACECPGADVRFLVGGTQTNATVIASLLESYEGVISAETGHIGVHEAGAVEATGHKVLPLPQHDGKLLPADLAGYLDVFYADGNHEHMVQPGMVYISHPTEYGTLYTAEELRELSGICRAHDLPLFMDGARLGYGLESLHTDVTLPLIAQLCDVFYIGGTKCGALFGEAVVFPKGAPDHFLTFVKQHGALLAKGFLLGLQFDTLFTDDLYFQISRHAIEMAEILKQGLRERGCRFYLDSPTNQQFIILGNAEMAELQKQVQFSFWEKYDEGHTVIRLATSWATKEEDVRALLALLK